MSLSGHWNRTGSFPERRYGMACRSFFVPAGRCQAPGSTSAWHGVRSGNRARTLLAALRQAQVPGTHAGACQVPPRAEAFIHWLANEAVPAIRAALSFQRGAETCPGRCACTWKGRSTA